MDTEFLATFQRMCVEEIAEAHEKRFQMQNLAMALSEKNMPSVSTNEMINHIIALDTVYEKTYYCINLFKF